ncbi:salivary peroxidase/catechol oxidase-like [Dermacentor andersoni]|uniref:salivary peroxidase/catechol oxidase-like n=1 Tax=Dermacentor andersoni TaxID=34620 RepID=UPI0021550742|nr:peroxidase-like [Dermacentor andersoni]
MLRRRAPLCLLWLAVSATSAMRSSRRYADLHAEARTELVEKMKYVMPRDDNGDPEASAYLGLPTDGCPFFKNVTKQLEEESSRQNQAINETFQDIKQWIESCQSSSNVTEVRNKILETLNASLTCEPAPACNASKPYREIDGSCNNLAHPDWGKTDSCLRRVLSPAYADGISKPRLSCNGSELPSARLISITLHEQKNVTHENLTHLAMIFGQFLTHDITFVLFGPFSYIEFELGTVPLDLCTADTDPECFPVDVPENDTFYKAYNVTKLAILRSLFCHKCENGYRDQMNSRTSYLDLSHVYGIKWDIHATVRTFNKGQLISQVVDDAEFPPDSPFPYADNCSILEQNRMCAWTGDLRAGQHIGLLSMQTLWLRQHNRIAKNLSKINPHWDDEKIFQTARRICEGIYQHIVFKEWLPLMLGTSKMSEFQLNPKENNYTDYNDSIDPTITNEFSAAAFRFGHSQIAENFWRYGKADNWLEPSNLSTAYFVPHNNSEGIHDEVLRGSLKQPMPTFDRYSDYSVTRNLFRQPHMQYGSDLSAIDIQRGRDHGLRPYVDYLQHCRNITVTTFENLTDLMAESNVTDIFKNLYGNVTDIDLYSGGLCEKPIEGAQVGETFAWIIARVFYGLKFGDRFYYEHGDQSGSFTKEQLQSIRNVTLASVFCQNIKDLHCIQRDVFLRQDSSKTKVVACTEIPHVNLSLWKDPTNAENTT